MAGAIAQDRQRCQFPFVVDEKPTFVPGGSAGEQSGGAQEVPCGAARSNSGRAAPSACVGKRFSAAQIIWNRSKKEMGTGWFFQSRQDSFVRLKDESLEDSDNRPDPDVLAREIVIP
jgi:hypothetical protein